MLAQERYAAILRMIRETNIVKIGDIAKKLKVSNETARRDLETLQDQKLLKRVHGGAVLVDPLIYTGPQSIPLPKEEVSYDEKSAIGAEAAKTVRNGETIFLDIGSTTLQIAKNLRTKRDLTVLTTSLDIINELAGTQVTLIILGGKLINDDLHIAAPFTEEILARYYVDRAFISCGGISPNGDITDYSDIALKRSVVREHASRMVLVADSGKFGKRAFVKVCDLKMLDSVITDTNLAPEYRDMLTERGLNVVFAEIRNRS